VSRPWRVRTTAKFDKQFARLERTAQRRILTYLEALEALDDPRQRGKALRANHSGVWRYRIGDYRVLAQITEFEMVVLAIAVGHRRDIY